MIQVTPQMRILVAVEPADFRKGIDGLARVCREVLSSDPFNKTWLKGRKMDALKKNFIVMWQSVVHDCS